MGRVRCPSRSRPPRRPGSASSSCWRSTTPTPRATSTATSSPRTCSSPARRSGPTVKLSDFGLAKSFRDNAGFAGLTHQGDIGGSGGFISPDHIRDFREAKEPADIYSAGATLYYLMTGQYPFFDFDPNRADAYTMILEHPAVPLRAHRPDLPEAFDRVLRKALEKQPSARWKSAAAMAAALVPFVGGT